MGELSCRFRRPLTLTRRTLLETTLKNSAGLTVAPGALRPAERGSPPVLTLRAAKPVPIPPKFTGLGYEMSSVAPLGLLSASNNRHVELIKGLGPDGVLRVGGIVADFTRYEPNGTIVAERQNTVITRASLDQFGAFLSEIGWSAIWSVNFAQGTLPEAVEESRAVASVLGSRLLALELGNEVDGYRKPFRDPPYNYDVFRKEYEEWHAAIVKAVPGVPFAAPDTASNVDWVEGMAKDARGKVQLLTTHYYCGGQDHGIPERLLNSDPQLIRKLERLRTASETSGIPWRMCETNSFFGGGRPGVSDTFIAALWTLDYMLLLTAYGCSGVNMETGVNQLGFVSSYSPVQDDGKGSNRAGVPYYGMLAYASATRGWTELFPVDVPASSPGLTAYALGNVGTVHSIVLVNRGDSDARVSLAALGLNRRLDAKRLRAPYGSSTSGVTFAGAAVNADGKWSPGTTEQINGPNVIVPKLSAVVLSRPS